MADDSPEANSPQSPPSEQATPKAVNSTRQNGGTIEMTTDQVDQQGPFDPSSIVREAAVDGPNRQFAYYEYQGIFPHPDFIDRYEKHAPGIAKEIFAELHEEARHRRARELAADAHERDMEKKQSQHWVKMETRQMELTEKAFNAGNLRAYIGMFLAWSIVISLVGAGVYALSNGNGWQGVALMSAAVTPVLGAFVTKEVLRYRKTSIHESDEGQESEVPD